jgi:hypothetical protein
MTAPANSAKLSSKHLEGRDVEIVRGLVEEQEIGRLQHEAGDVHARPLPSGQA